eukprot:gene41444-51320_t
MRSCGWLARWRCAASMAADACAQAQTHNSAAASRRSMELRAGRAGKQAKPHPGLCAIFVTGRSSGWPSSFPNPAFPCNAQWRPIEVVRLTAAGAAPDWREMKIPRVTGFPFHPPADKRKGHLTGRVHLAFQAQDRDMVHAFYQAALAHGGQDNGAPGERPYHPGYYAAFVLDPDGNNIEAVFHGEAKRSAPSVEITF